ncbi:hypothetical protein [Nocardiopsis salina]|uniref:hypothetical protein n=1 Tax=Nocardiopsis salina TaxID=245836 RepID=UPI00034D7F74|nr:hypothetical protein [Nocardiopsis salina]
MRQHSDEHLVAAAGSLLGRGAGLPERLPLRSAVRARGTGTAGLTGATRLGAVSGLWLTVAGLGLTGLRRAVAGLSAGGLSVGGLPAGRGLLSGLARLAVRGLLRGLAEGPLVGGNTGVTGLRRAVPGLRRSVPGLTRLLRGPVAGLSVGGLPAGRGLLSGLARLAVRGLLRGLAVGALVTAGHTLPRLLPAVLGRVRRLRPRGLLAGRLRRVRLLRAGLLSLLGVVRRRGVRRGIAHAFPWLRWLGALMGPTGQYRRPWGPGSEGTDRAHVL